MQKNLLTYDQSIEYLMIFIKKNTKESLVKVSNALENFSDIITHNHNENLNEEDSISFLNQKYINNDNTDFSMCLSAEDWSHISTDIKIKNKSLYLFTKKDYINDISPYDTKKSHLDTLMLTQKPLADKDNLYTYANTNAKELGIEPFTPILEPWDIDEPFFKKLLNKYNIADSDRNIYQSSIKKFYIDTSKSTQDSLPFAIEELVKESLNEIYSKEDYDFKQAQIKPLIAELSVKSILSRFSIKSKPIDTCQLSRLNSSQIKNLLKNTYKITQNLSQELSLNRNIKQQHNFILKRNSMLERNQEKANEPYNINPISKPLLSEKTISDLTKYQEEMIKSSNPKILLDKFSIPYKENKGKYLVNHENELITLKTNGKIWEANRSESITELIANIKDLPKEYVIQDSIFYLKIPNYKNNLTDLLDKTNSIYHDDKKQNFLNKIKNDIKTLQSKNIKTAQLQNTSRALSIENSNTGKHLIEAEKSGYSNDGTYYNHKIKGVGQLDASDSIKRKINSQLKISNKINLSSLNPSEISATIKVDGKTETIGEYINKNPQIHLSL